MVRINEALSGMQTVGLLLVSFIFRWQIYNCGRMQLAHTHAPTVLLPPQPGSYQRGGAGEPALSCVQPRASVGLCAVSGRSSSGVLPASSTPRSGLLQRLLVRPWSLGVQQCTLPNGMRQGAVWLAGVNCGVAAHILGGDLLPREGAWPFGAPLWCEAAAEWLWLPFCCSWHHFECSVGLSGCLRGLVVS